MAKIRITNKKTALRKLGGYLKAGLITGAVFGATWILPRAINQYNLDSKIEYAYEVISDQGYFNEASEPNSIYSILMKRLNQTPYLEDFVNQEFLFPERAQHKIDGLEGRIRVEREKIAMSEMDRMIIRRQYFDAEATLRGLKLTKILDEEALFKMSQSVSQIHPAELEKKADIQEGGFTQLALYEAAEREFRLLGGEEREGLSDKIVGAHLKTIEEGYDNQNKNLDPSVDIKNFIGYLESNSIDTSIGSERANEFFIKSNKFMGRMLSENKTLTTIKLYLDRTNDLATILKMENAEQEVKTLAMKFADRLIYMAQNKSRGGEFYIDHATSLNENYRLGREEEIADLFTQIYDKAEDKVKSQKLLSDALVYAEALPEETQNRIKTEVADRYFEFARDLEDRGEAYLLFQTARGIYDDAGVGLDDERFLRLNEAIENKLYGGVEKGVKGEAKRFETTEEKIERLEKRILMQNELLLKTLVEEVK